MSMEIRDIRIVKSPNRKKTVSARLDGEIMIVQAPEAIPEKELAGIIESFRKKFTRRKLRRELNSVEDLRAVAEALNDKYFGGAVQVNSIEYVTNQTCKFGVCNAFTKGIRISGAVAGMPDWVKKYVIIHEMAHILEPNHGKNFWALVNRYKLAERARGYLIAKSIEI